MTDPPGSQTAEPCFCTAVRQAARHVSQLYDTALAPVQLSVNQFAVLVRIDRFGPGAIQDLAANLVMDRSTLGHLLRPLEARGLVTLAPSPDDRRRRVLALTPEGSALLDAARPLWAGAQQGFAAAYGADARRLRDMLDDVAALRFADAPDAPPSPSIPA